MKTDPSQFALHESFMFNYCCCSLVTGNSYATTFCNLITCRGCRFSVSLVHTHTHTNIDRFVRAIVCPVQSCIQCSVFYVFKIDDFVQRISGNNDPFYSASNAAAGLHGLHYILSIYVYLISYMISKNIHNPLKLTCAMKQ